MGIQDLDFKKSLYSYAFLSLSKSESSELNQKCACFVVVDVVVFCCLFFFLFVCLFFPSILVFDCFFYILPSLLKAY